MKNYFFKYFAIFLTEYIFIFLLSTTFLFISFTKSFSKENVFTINNIKVTGTIDLNFSRDKYLNKAFKDSYEALMSKILLSKDLKKMRQVNLMQIKNLINSFQILNESYSKDEYTLNIKILYNEKKVKKFLRKKNISFSQPENISAIFYPVLFIEDEIISLNDNFFYKNWNKIVIENESINFILPLEDLDDISEIVKMKNEIEELDLSVLISKYDMENYIFALMNYDKNNLNIHLKTNFNNTSVNKNVFYKLNFEDESSLNSIIKDLKFKISDMWKEQNLINLLMPLSINIQFNHKNINNLNELRNVFNKITIIDNYELEEFNTSNSSFKIYYYGNPKKLKSQLLKFGYLLNDNQGFWQLYLNE
mgnify:CR=1 FL=1